MKLTNPRYISQQMFDKAIREKFHDNPDDQAVQQQGSQMMQLVTGSQLRDQIVTDILHAAKVSGYSSKEQTAVIAFCMGLQFGFELGLTYPPLSAN